MKNSNWPRSFRPSITTSQQLISKVNQRYGAFSTAPPVSSSDPPYPLRRHGAAMLSSAARSAAHEGGWHLPGRHILPQPGGNPPSSHRRNQVIDPEIHEHDPAIRGANPKRSRASHDQKCERIWKLPFFKERDNRFTKLYRKWLALLRLPYLS